MERIKPVASAAPVGPSDRSFGLTMAAVALIVAGVFDFGAGWRIGLVCVAAVVAVLAVVRPSLLASANHGWMWFGERLHHVVSPLVLGLMFFVVITPVALVTRLFGRDALNLKPADDSASHWVEREPDQQPGGGMSRPY